MVDGNIWNGEISVFGFTISILKIDKNVYMKQSS